MSFLTLVWKINIVATQVHLEVPHLAVNIARFGVSHDIIDMHGIHYYCQDVGNDGDVVEEVPEVSDHLTKDT